MDKIKVVWLCHFSNPVIHRKLELSFGWLYKLLIKLTYKSVTTDVPEYAKWITNGIIEIEKLDDVELHVVSPYPHLKSKVQEFTINGIYYHFFSSEDDSLITIFYKKIFKPQNYQYWRNCKTIKRLIKRIKPDIVHMFGAENPDYALGVFSVPKNVIIIAQLQTLLNDPDFKKNYPIDEITYNYRARTEKSILLKADYLGTTAKKYRELISNVLNPRAVILNTTLAFNEPILMNACKKSYDFVYFAADISKAADLAIEAFCLAYKEHPNITLDIVGGYDVDFKKKLDRIIDKYGARDVVTFEGKLPTHDDVINQIRKSRYALLPLKIDLTSGTIREAMSNGLPVITTDTGVLGTQRLNVDRPCAMLSMIGDHRAMADNMLRLLDDKGLVEELRQNAYQTRQEVLSNMEVVKKYVVAYRACLENQRNKRPLPKELIEI